ncbi:hypothetical protein EON65_55000 [archaeon]|nr:MAG: hypothetical protein EON65_55000 [archaeon]
MADSKEVNSYLSSWEALCSYYLANHLYESAKFYAERLYYERPDANSLYVLAECYYRTGKVNQSYLILQEIIFSACHEARYLFSLVCISLGKLEEAEAVLLSNALPMHQEHISSANMTNIPGGSNGVFLLGKICKRQQRSEVAKKYLTVALQVICTMHI